MKHLLYFMGLVQLKVRAQTEQCPSSESQWSISGWMLQRHIYKTMPSDLGLRCLVRCQTDDRCQSFNFVLSRHMCEFSDRTKEASPKDFIPDPDRYYFTRKKDRGKKWFVRVSIHSKRENGLTVIVVFTRAREWGTLPIDIAHFKRNHFSQGILPMTIWAHCQSFLCFQSLSAPPLYWQPYHVKK